MARFNTSEVIQQCVEKLSELYKTQVSLKSSQSVGGGCINQAVRITTNIGDFFVKWNASAPVDMFQKEAFALTEMQQEDNPYLIIPKVIWATSEEERPGIILMEYLHPAVLTNGYDEKLGRGIAQLHRKTASAYGFYHSNYCGTTIQDNTWTSNWPEFFAQRRIGALVQQIRISRGLTVDQLKIYDRLIDQMPLLLPQTTVPSLIHGDLWSGNYMYTAKGPALIDPACYYADREMELGMMQLFGGFSSRVWQAYNEDYPLQDGWEDRILLYQLYHVLNHQLLFGGSYGWQALSIAKDFI